MSFFFSLSSSSSSFPFYSSFVNNFSTNITKNLFKQLTWNKSNNFLLAEKYISVANREQIPHELVNKYHKNAEKNPLYRFVCIQLFYLFHFLSKIFQWDNFNAICRKKKTNCKDALFYRKTSIGQKQKKLPIRSSNDTKFYNSKQPKIN